ncbi:MAG: response regulator transcription factor [Ignavibacteriales bacterium]|nr:response regulator transcription factor [Ignavibacteriales bacterium]
MRALIVDDHEFTREGIVHILTDNFDITKLARAGNYDEAMEQIKNNKWDIIILDVNLPGKGGLEILRTIRIIESKVPVLVLSMVPVSQYARRIVQAGASGYLTKSEPGEELIKAVRMVARGMKYFSPEVQQELPDIIDESIDKAKHHNLSDREFEVLRGLAEGKSSKEIAGEYKVSINTINSYRKRVLLKLHARSNIDLVKYAYKHKIVE